MGNDNASTDYAGGLSGAGSRLVKIGSGILTLTGSSTYSGGTTIAAGRLQLGDGLASNGYVAGNITDNSLLVFANPAARTFSGAISGAGTVIKSGTGADPGQHEHLQRRHGDLRGNRPPGLGLGHPQRGLGRQPDRRRHAGPQRLLAHAQRHQHPDRRPRDEQRRRHRDLTVQTNVDNTINGTIDDGAGTLGLIKTGSADLTVANSLTYSGQTQINQGTLTLAAASLAGPVTVNNGGALAGIGATVRRAGPRRRTDRPGHGRGSRHAHHSRARP